ncbi:DHA2 family efflux MFS transporter permease subunit [Sporolactobacillus sp. CPB3-1]|uniref:DHA2 family efflux MFS transporter permease subunit n=1 Tax=Sporolactobacillus mangiferae TaxID=2940498 RepID=A0ABT0MA37_9BACL|nr:DHA2 family efflux MFS transporter permease subunit [Sporolactobacillus mangiferae]MCL1631719.1 DHA2 family efflux MFS transporter permease subunit [Sporolactobacillus mangiferae]
MSVGVQQRIQVHDNLKVIPIMIVLISGGFVTILNQTLLVTALPSIMHDLHLTSVMVQWLQTVFLLVNGIMIPITAFLEGRFTTRSLFLFAMGSFALGTLVCMITDQFVFLIIGRVIQAVGAGIMMPLMQAVMFIIFPVEKRGQVMGIFGLVIGFAPAIGPTLSGWLINHYSWRILFDVVLPIAVLDFILAFFILKNVTKRTYPKLDVFSIILSTIGFGGLLYGSSVAGSLGWGNPEVLLTLAVGAAALALFIIRQLRLDQPILEFKVFQYPIFTLTTAIGMLSFAVFIAGATMLPIYMQTMLGYSPLKSGLMLLPGAVVMGVMSPITGRIFDKIGARGLSITGISILLAMTLLMSRLSASTSFTYLATVNAVRMMGLSMVLMPTTTAGLNQLPHHLIPHGTAMNNTMRQVAGSIGTALLFTVMASSVQNPQKYGIAGLIHGVDIAFLTASVLCLGALILTFFVKKPNY